MTRRGLSLVDVLVAALERSDARCGPPVDLLAAAMRPADVQRSVQRESAPMGEVPVILGTFRPAR